MSRHLKLSVAVFIPRVFFLTLNACNTPQRQLQANTIFYSLRLMSESVVVADGYVLPLKIWPSTESPVAVVFALHDFNNYSHAFDAAAHGFAATA